MISQDQGATSAQRARRRASSSSSCAAEAACCSRLGSIVCILSARECCWVKQRYVNMIGLIGTSNWICQDMSRYVKICQIH